MSSEEKAPDLESSTHTEVFLFTWNLVFFIISNWMVKVTVQFIHSKPPGRKLVGNEVEQKIIFLFS